MAALLKMYDILPLEGESVPREYKYQDAVTRWVTVPARPFSKSTDPNYSSFSQYAMLGSTCSRPEGVRCRFRPRFPTHWILIPVTKILFLWCNIGNRCTYIVKSDYSYPWTRTKGLQICSIVIVKTYNVIHTRDSLFVMITDTTGCFWVSFRPHRAACSLDAFLRVFLRVNTFKPVLLVGKDQYRRN